MSGSDTISLARLPRDRATEATLVPEPGALRALADRLDLLDLRKLRFVATLQPLGKRDWDLSGHLGATVVQPCVATLAPVTTRIETPVARRYLADFIAPIEEEAEMPEDDSTDALPESLDLSAVAEEALALALPLYPRAADAPADPVLVGPPGVAPMTDDDAKPLAGLAALRDRLAAEKPDDDTPKD